MGSAKYDHEPLLAPGRHYLSLREIYALCVNPFEGQSHSCREKLFYSFESFVQRLLVARIRCEVFLDGSFVTAKPQPDDVDVIVSVEHPTYETLSDEQKELLDAINNDPSFQAGVDCFAATTYPREHERFGTAADIGNAGEAYGVEHGQVWLKGYVVLRLWESDVRNRICR